MEIQFAHQFAW